jgi:CRP-like cAMP-binding protein
MDAFLELAADLPRQSLNEGETLLREGTVPGRLFVLLRGSLLIQKEDVPITMIRDAGSCVGEVSLLLGIPATADVVAAEPTVVAVVDDAARQLDVHPDLARALATMLATRVQHMTTYLADLKRQYADHEGGLGMVDAVLGSLMHHGGTRSEFGSARDPHPEY